MVKSRNKALLILFWQKQAITTQKNKLSIEEREKQALHKKKKKS
jgi:hypothetical protein